VGVVGPLSSGVVQPGADDPVGVSVGEPGVPQQRPRGQQHLVAELDGASGEGEQPFGGEGLQHLLHVLGLSRAFALGQVRPGRPAGGVDAVGAGGGQPQEHLPGRGLLGRGEMVVGALGAGGDRAVDAAGPVIVGQGEGVPGPGPPGLVQGVRQQRQGAGAEGAGLAGAHLGQQQVGQVVLDLRAGFLGRLGDRHPQLPLGHRRHQVPVLDRVSQLRVVRAPGLKIGAHPQHDQRRRGLVWAVAGCSGRVQRGDERPPLPLLGALGEQLLELVHHQQQPSLPQLPVVIRRAAIGISRRPARPGQDGLPGGQREPGRSTIEPAPHRRRVRPGQHRHPQRQLIQRRPGRGQHHPRPPRRPGSGGQPIRPEPRQYPCPQQRRLARPRHPRHHHQAHARQQPRHPLQHLNGGGGAAEEQARVLLLEHAQPAVGRTGHQPRLRSRAVDGREHVEGRDLAAGCCHEQFPGLPGQAQSAGQQHGGVLMGGAGDASLQAADRPRGQARCLGQFLLGQLGLGPQLPQQPGEAQPRLGHHPASPHNLSVPGNRHGAELNRALNSTQAQVTSATSRCPGRILIGGLVTGLVTGPVWCTPSRRSTVESAPG
jgi:hypothetical protein